MTSEVRCSDCDTVIEEPTDTPVDERQPCPNCGSTARLVAVESSDSFRVTDSVETLVKKDGTYCGNCERPLDEPRLPADEVPACPSCGSVDRLYVESVTVRPDPARARASIPPPKVITTGKADLPPFQTSGTARVTLPEVVHKIRTIKPTGKDGSFTMMAVDGDDNILAVVECEDWEDGYLELAEAMRPEEPTT